MPAFVLKRVPMRSSLRRPPSSAARKGCSRGDRRPIQAADQCTGVDHVQSSGGVGGCAMNLSGPFINRPVATSLLMAALAVIGLAAFPFLPVAPLPQVDFPTIQVTATLSGASAET